ncbi:MAG: hypothetical protein ACMXX7_02540 [Candidatus Woesearchaeota archaeon]
MKKENIGNVKKIDAEKNLENLMQEKEKLEEKDSKWTNGFILTTGSSILSSFILMYRFLGAEGRWQEKQLENTPVLKEYFSSKEAFKDLQDQIDSSYAAFNTLTKNEIVEGVEVNYGRMEELLEGKQQKIDSLKAEVPVQAFESYNNMPDSEVLYTPEALGFLATVIAYSACAGMKIFYKKKKNQLNKKIEEYKATKRT